MVYPVGETAKLLGVVKNIREEDVPERFRAIRAELRGVPNKNIDEGADAMQHLPPFCYKYLPVILSGFFWISSGVPVATTRPPLSPPPGPMSMT